MVNRLQRCLSNTFRLPIMHPMTSHSHYQPLNHLLAVPPGDRMSIQQQKLQQTQNWRAKLVRKRELSNLRHQAPPIPFLILFSRQAAVPLVSSHLCRCCHISWHPGRRQLEPSGSGWKARGADGRRSQPAARAPQTAGQVPSVVSGTPSAQLAAMP